LLPLLSENHWQVCQCVALQLLILTDSHRITVEVSYISSDVFTYYISDIENNHAYKSDIVFHCLLFVGDAF